MENNKFRSIKPKWKGKPIIDFNGNPVMINNIPSDADENQIMGAVKTFFESGIDYGSSSVDYSHILTGKPPAVTSPQVSPTSPQQMGGSIKAPNIDKSKLNPLNAIIRGLGEGVLPGSVQNIVTPVVSGIESIVTDRPYQDIKSEKIEEDIAMRKEHPFAYGGAELVGSLHPKSLFSKLYNIGKVPQSASLLYKILSHAGKGFMAGSGTEAMKRLPELLNKETSAESLKDVVGSGISTASVSAPFGTFGSKIASEFEKPKGAEKIAGEIMDSFKDAPEKFSKYVGELGKTPAKTTKTRQLIDKILKEHGVFDKKGFPINQEKMAETVFKGEALGAKEKGQLVKFLEGIAGAKKTTPRTVEDISALKKKWGDTIKNVPKGERQIINNKLMTKINNSMRDDIIDGITKTHGEEIGREARNAYTQYSNMKSIQDIYKLKPNGFLSVDQTLNNLNKYSDKAISGLFGKNADNILKLRRKLTDYALAGVKEIKLPSSQDKLLRTKIEGMTKKGMTFEAIMGATNLLGQAIEKVPPRILNSINL